VNFINCKALCHTVHNERLRRTRPIPNTKTRRDPSATFAEILEACKQPTAKTHIMYKTNLSYDATLKFLKRLQKLELLKLNQDNKKYETTEKGFEFLKKNSELRKILRP